MEQFYPTNLDRDLLVLDYDSEMRTNDNMDGEGIPLTVSFFILNI